MQARRSAPGAYMPRTRAKQSTPLTPNLQTAWPGCVARIEETKAETGAEPEPEPESEPEPKLEPEPEPEPELG